MKTTIIEQLSIWALSITVICAVVILIQRLLFKTLILKMERLASHMGDIDQHVKTEIQSKHQDTQLYLNQNREEISSRLTQTSEQLTQMVSQALLLQQQNVNGMLGRQTELKTETQNQLEGIRHVMGQKIEDLQQVVDQKLESTITTKFNETFNIVSQRMNEVNMGLGELQNVSERVNELKKALLNVKTRGNIGEIQLQNIISDVFGASQYQKNIITKPDTKDAVEFVITIPQQDGLPDILLPIDSKFVLEDYTRLSNHTENSQNTETKDLDREGKKFETTVKRCAQKIQEKYINPPITTDYAIMFIPSEGIFSEILSRPHLVQDIYRTYRISIAGPSYLLAHLSAIQLGIKTTWIEQHSAQITSTLVQIKTEVNTIVTQLEKTRKKLIDATKDIESTAQHSRNIEHSLNQIESDHVEIPETSIDLIS
jgi:DNA recombination protein RmuC